MLNNLSTLTFHDKREGGSIEEKIQEGIQKFMAEVTNRIIRERDAFWAAEMAKMNAAIRGNNVQINGSPNLDSQQGSCSKGGHANMAQGVKKKLDLIQDKKSTKEQKLVDHEDIENKCEVEEKFKEEEKNDHVEEKNGVEEMVEVLEIKDQHEEAVLPKVDSSKWKLTFGSPPKVVAYAIVDMDSDVIHGKPSGKENARAR